MIPGSTAARYDSKDHAWEAGRRAVEDALRRRGIAGKVLPGQYPALIGLSERSRASP